MDDDKKVQSEFIELPPFLSYSGDIARDGIQMFSACSTVYETTCPSCQGVPCQSCQSCLGVSCQSCQCSAQENQGCQTACEIVTQIPSGSYIDFMDVGPTSIKVRLAGLDTTSQNNMGTNRTPRHNSYKISVLGDQRTLAKGSGGSSGTTTYNGLVPGTKYHFVATVNFTSNTNITSNVTLDDYCSTAEELRPYYFSWNSGPAAIKPPDNLLKSGGKVPTALRWNQLTSSINEMREYSGFNNYNFTNANAGVTVLTAAMVNQCITAISPMKPSIPLPVASYRGDVLSAALLNKLSNALNSIQ